MDDKINMPSPTSSPVRSPHQKDPDGPFCSPSFPLSFAMLLLHYLIYQLLFRELLCGNWAPNGFILNEVLYSKSSDSEKWANEKKKKINKEARRNSGAHECWTRWEEWALLHTVGRTACACRHFGKPPGLLLGRRVERESLLPRPAPVVQACPRESSGLAHKSTQPTLAGSLGGLREGIKSFPAF